MKKTTGTNSESGAALLMVLGVLSVCMLLIAHLMMVTELISKEALLLTRKQRLRYQAESGADLSYWMHLTDRRLFSDRRLGQSQDDEMRQSMEFEPWMLDRRPHNLDNGLVQTFLASGEEGFKVNQPDSLRNNIGEDEPELLDEVNVFLDILEDYMDNDDLHKLNGMESEHYAADGFPTLPRNGAMEFKAELYWLPGWRNAIPGEIAVLPPSGKSYPTQARNARPSFFSASNADIARILGLDEIGMEEVLQARELWETEGVELSESLSEELWSQVQSNFDFTENNLAQIYAVAYEPDRSVHAMYKIIRETNISRASCYSDRKQETMAIWERMLE
ncbi:MAG: hypothetical protein GX946_08405 [Oligosphaeraceae bacterium]|nr:hypothetical protein [Oligosphaeraceae bacterium]